MVQQSSVPADNSQTNQMFLVDLGQKVPEANSLDDLLAETREIWTAISERMDPAETCWVVAPNDYRDGRMWPVAMAVADDARAESDLALKNTITVHRWNDRGGPMESAYDEILFFVRDKREYKFYKDEIRVSHVYEGNEWGENREKGYSAYHDTESRRYNPDGKDPGNVWLDEDRTRTDGQEIDRTGPIALEEAVRRCVLVGSDGGEEVRLLWADERLEEVVGDEGRKAERVDAATLRKEVAK